MTLTVKDILYRPYFKGTKMLAGRKGLSRPVKWVHIVETDTFGHLLNGEEVILTTGVGWADKKEKSISFVKQLIDSNASALCVELVNHVRTLPEEMIALAEEHHLPVIIFQHEVKFIEITKDLHKIILGYDEQAWWKLDHLYKELNEALLSNQPIGEFLKILHKNTKRQVALAHQNGEYRFFPALSRKKQLHWMKQIEDEEERSLFYSHPVYFLREEIARIYLLDTKKNSSLFDELSAKRCSEFLSQYYWKYYQHMETRRMERDNWLLDAVQGHLSKEEIVEKLLQHAPSIHLNEAIIGVIPYQHHSPSREEQHDVTRMLMKIHTILEKQSIYLATVLDESNDCLVLFMMNQNDNTSFHNRLLSLIHELRQANTDQFSFQNEQWLSFGRIIHEYSDLPLSYSTSLKTLNYQRKYGKQPEPFYSKLGIFRFIDQIEDKEELKELVDDYIGKIIAYDREKDTELLKTLHVYLKHFGAKNETARELFIVRQTLYHRLDRIKELLGEDYLNLEKRMMIELAIYAYDHMQKQDEQLLLNG